MNSPVIQLLVLAGIAIFLILRLRSVLGTREGFEKPRAQPTPASSRRSTPDLEVIDGGPDPDITDYVDAESESANALAAMKSADRSFNVREFVRGARGAYEMILTGFENGDLSEIKPFLSDDVYEAFAGVVESREKSNLSVDFNFIGISETTLVDADYDATSKNAEVSVRFVSESTSAVYDNGGDLIEGSATDVKKQRDVWTFGRTMGTGDPNWFLVATGE
ncbi:Tim44/TimA family putative adaptor protein [Octadecabacter sp. 1_MG-2023]|uniref:Tim44/TimA family putative adaptor protein n=1 Tax=unclassified Octadecabacter TaxID=196158 RepID=UPI001C07FF96|nr:MULTISPECIES: Tim44/TimA family putative adaptor protein [unclassified Octadecabacter]MBU2992320.1 Tim44/TimA family putative adaptor protein [Octadecabacter sp. B2R22]MDO6734923.1 Tim44/TimA family putative adaptor protein [Octadecabacter sp. 1_MG-2023]